MSPETRDVLVISVPAITSLLGTWLLNRKVMGLHTQMNSILDKRVEGAEKLGRAMEREEGRDRREQNNLGG